MVRRKGKVLGTLALSLALACGAVSPLPAVAEETENQTLPHGDYSKDGYELNCTGTGTGETKLYLRHDQYVSVVNEGAVNEEQLVVSIPVGIHFVMGRTGRIVGPSDGKVKFANKMQTSSVHVSGIAVSSTEGVEIVESSEHMPNNSGRLFIRMRPDKMREDGNKLTTTQTGTLDEFGAYSGTEAKSPRHKDEWNLEPGEYLVLDSLAGNANPFGLKGRVNTADDVQIGSVFWTVRLGTRQDADLRDASVTIRFHPNGGAYTGTETLEDMSIRVLNVDALPEIVPDEDQMATDIPSGAGILAMRMTDMGLNVVSLPFEGWYLDETCKEPFEGLESLGDAEEIAGKTFTLYAGYEE